MCKHCNLVNCSILNKSECPINKLWEQSEQDKPEYQKRIDTFTENSLMIGLHNATIMLASFQHNHNN